MAAAPPAAAAAAPAPPAAPEPPPGPLVAPSGGRLGVQILSWHAVAAWTWNAGDDVCGICRTAFDGCPPEAKFPGDDSPVVWGRCTHAFHLPCIQRALVGKNKCPLCRRDWEARVVRRRN